MKFKFFTLLLFFLCIGKINAQEFVASFTTSTTGGKFSFGLIGSDLQVDWGDGTLVSVEPQSTNGWLVESPSNLVGPLTTIKVYGNIVLTLNLNNCNITDVEFGAKADELLIFRCSNNPLSVLDLSGLSKLGELTMISCPNLLEVDLKSNPLLVSLNASGNQQIEVLDLSLNPLLKTLDISSSRIIDLDLSANRLIESLDISYMDLSSVNLLNQDALKKLSCQYNKLVNLNLSNSASLRSLRCDNNKLESITLNPSVIEMDELMCNNNSLTFATLPRVKKSATVGNFIFGSQAPFELVLKSDKVTVDLSREAVVAGYAPTATAPVNSKFIWKFASSSSWGGATLDEVTAYFGVIFYQVMSPGVFKFDINAFNQFESTEDGTGAGKSLILEITNAGFSGLKLVSSGSITLPDNPVGIEDADTPQIAVYPNPFTDYVTVKGFSLGSKLEIMDVNGKSVYSCILSIDGQILPLSKLSSGIYILSLFDGQKRYSTKIVK